jgi:hypothetical protein
MSLALLLLSVLLWATTLLAGYLRIVPAELALGIGSYAGIAIGLSAAACVIFRFVIRRKAN